jgi:hypothetical protein
MPDVRLVLVGSFDKEIPMAMQYRPATVKTITPAIAERILNRTQMQRPLSNAHVLWLAEQMRNLAFKVNGESVILSGPIDDPDTEVIDGQHRLWACIESGVSFQSYVVEGMAQEVFPTIGSGKGRTKADVAGIQCGRDSPQRALRPLSTAAGTIQCFDLDGRYNANTHKQITNQKIVDWLRVHPDIVDDAKTMASFGKALVTPSIVLTVYYLVKRGYPNAMEEFVRPLVKGENLAANSPILMLRQKVLNEPRKDFRDMLALAIKTWNAHADGEGPRLLRYSAGTESFPSLKLRPAHQPARRKRA